MKCREDLMMAVAVAVVMMEAAAMAEAVTNVSK
jgi:hypothetical protein